MSVNYNPHIIEDIPYVLLRDSSSGNNIYWRGDCMYNNWSDEYDIYLGGGYGWTNAIKDDSSDNYDHYVLKYKLNGDSDYTVVEYNNFEVLKTDLRTKTTVTDVIILYGSLTAPSFSARLIPGTEDTPPYLALSRYEDGVYQWDIVGKIPPKVSYKYIGDPETPDEPWFQLVENLFVNNTETDNFVFGGKTVHQMLKPQIKIDVIETSSPQDPSKGYQVGEDIMVSLKIMNTSPNYWTGDMEFIFELTGDAWTIGNFAPGTSREFVNVTYTVTPADIAGDLDFNMMWGFGYAGELYNWIGETEEPDFIVNSPDIKIYHPKKYWDVTYTTNNGVTTTTRYYEYNEIKDFFKNSSLVITQVKIEEGSE